MMKIYKLEKHEGSKKRKELQDLWKETTTEDLIWLLINSEQESIQKKAWEKLKASGELMLSDMFDLECGPEFIQVELLKMFLEEAGPEDLFEAMDSGSSFFEEAEKKLFRIIGAKKPSIRKGRAMHILLRIIEEIPPSREKAFKLFKKQGPSEAQLQKALNMKAVQHDPAMQAEIERLIRKVAKKDSRSRKLRQLEKLEKQKKEQN